MTYLKITRPDKTVTFVSENTEIVLTLAPANTANNVFTPGRITGVHYSNNTSVDITNIPAYDGTNTLYQYGKISDHGQIQTIFSN